MCWKGGLNENNHALLCLGILFDRTVCAFLRWCCSMRFSSTTIAVCFFGSGSITAIRQSSCQRWRCLLVIASLLTTNESEQANCLGGRRFDSTIVGALSRELKVSPNRFRTVVTLG